MDDVYSQHIRVHLLTMCIPFTTKPYFCNYQISTHYLPHVLNLGNFKTMILNVEKNPCHQVPMTCDGATWQYQNPPCGIMRNFG